MQSKSNQNIDYGYDCQAKRESEQVVHIYILTLEQTNKILTGLSIYAWHALMKIIVERGTRMTFLHECRRVMRPVHGLAI